MMYVVTIVVRVMVAVRSCVGAHRIVLFTICVFVRFVVCLCAYVFIVCLVWFRECCVHWLLMYVACCCCCCIVGVVF